MTFIADRALSLFMGFYEKWCCFGGIFRVRNFKQMKLMDGCDISGDIHPRDIDSGTGTGNDLSLFSFKTLALTWYSS